MTRFYLHDGAYHELPPGASPPPDAIAVPYLPGAWEVWDAAQGAFALASGAISQLHAQVDADAERARDMIVTPGSGQAMTYLRKETEARAYLADNTSPTPFLAAEAQATGVTVANLAVSVVDRADAWASIGPKIEAARIAAKQQISNATSAADAVSAAQVNWRKIMED